MKMEACLHCGSTGLKTGFAPDKEYLYEIMCFGCNANIFAGGETPEIAMARAVRKWNSSYMRAGVPTARQNIAARLAGQFGLSLTPQAAVERAFHMADLILEAK